jgi:DNA-binding CsgD family transcriptional regulator
MMQLELNPRDQQIVGFLLQGCSNDEIAAGVGISVPMLKHQLGALYERAGIAAGRKRVRLIKMLAEHPDIATVTDLRRNLPAMAPTERLIAELTISGLTNSEIGERCGFTEQVVKNFLRHVFDKCGVWSRTELAARFRVSECER